MTLLVAMLIRDTVFLPALATQTLDPSVTRPRGVPPTAVVATTVLSDVRIRDTVLLPAFATHTDAPSLLTATADAALPTATVATTAPVVLLITDTEFFALLAT